MPAKAFSVIAAVIFSALITIVAAPAAAVGERYLGDAQEYWSRGDLFTGDKLREYLDIEGEVGYIAANSRFGWSLSVTVKPGADTDNIYNSDGEKVVLYTDCAVYNYRVVDIYGNVVNKNQYSSYHMDFGKVTHSVKGLTDGALTPEDIAYVEYDITLLCDRTLTKANPVYDCSVRAYNPFCRVKDIAQKAYTEEPVTVKVTFAAQVHSDCFILKCDSFGEADAYGVYLYNDSTGGYELYDTVSGRECTVSGLERNKKYSFYVAALKEKDGRYYVHELSCKAAVSTKDVTVVNLTQQEYEEFRGADGRIHILSDEDCIYYYNGRRVG